MAEPTFPPIDVSGSGQLYARLHTTQGAIVIRLEEQLVPKTVASFVGLATGAIDWKDPKTGDSMRGKPHLRWRALSPRDPGLHGAGR